MRLFPSAQKFANQVRGPAQNICNILHFTIGNVYPPSNPQTGGLPFVLDPNCLFHTCTRNDHSNLDAGPSPNKTSARTSDQHA